MTSLRLLGIVCYAVSIQHHALVSAKETSLRRTQVDLLHDTQHKFDSDRSDALPVARRNDMEHEDSSIRILYDFFQRRGPKQQKYYKHRPPPPPHVHPHRKRLPPPPPPKQPVVVKRGPPPPRKKVYKQHPKEDMFAAQYNHYAKHKGSMSKKSKRKGSNDHAYYVKGGPYQYHQPPKPSKKHDPGYAYYRPKDKVEDDSESNEAIVTDTKGRRKWTKWVAVRKGGKRKGHHVPPPAIRWKPKTKTTHPGKWWEQGEGYHKNPLVPSPPPPSSPFPPAPTVVPPSPPVASPVVSDTTPEQGTFTRLAMPVTGQEPGGQFGRAVATNRFGNYMAVGSPSAIESAGLVRVYLLEDGAWVQVGQDIEGPEPASLTGFALDISDDGTIVAVGDLRIGSDGGQVRVFEYNPAGDRWVQRGETIRGSAMEGDLFGASVAISSTGEVVAVGSPGNSANGDNAGQVRVFVWNTSSSQWDRLGSPIDGEAGDLAGFSMSISGDGKTLAYGLPTHDVVDSISGEALVDAGQVRVVRFDSVTGEWISQGNTIDGPMDGAEAGWDVELSSQGDRVIVGMPGTTVPVNDVPTEDTGIIRVYQQEDRFSSWLQLGQDFLGNGLFIPADLSVPGSRLGQSVAMSDDGTTIVFFAGPTDESSGGGGGGRVLVFVCNETDFWIQRDEDIVVDVIGPVPAALSLSDTGSIVMIGSVGGQDGVGESTGFVSSARRGS